MNPPTPGHKLLRDKVLSLADDCDSDHLIVLSRTHNNLKNPLAPDLKIHYIKEVVGPANYEFASDELPTLIQWMTYLNRECGYESLILVCGTDRRDEYSNLIDKYNGIDFEFDSVLIQTCGSEKTRNDCSSTAVRKAVYDMDYKSFISFYPNLNHLVALNLFRDIGLINRIHGGRKPNEPNRSKKAKEEKRT